MKLYKVTIERTLYVMAEDDAEAFLDAGRFEREAASDTDADLVTVDEVQPGDSVPAEWAKALPYGDYEGVRTVGQIVDELTATPARCTRTAELFP